ncbi:unnamed protein product [Litomosoides sigmodontis]|uniref:SEFIR domain-containing protein n=1 Tax=Litomosoides sigmodontis TaxID=42156 RepID=A0A3P6SCF7_LITSI|nr:unnamed protein product [Litomosoides sigmodontis]
MFFVDFICAECREEIKVLPRNSREFTVFRNLYIFENDTQKCDEAESQLIPSQASFCDSHDVNVTFSSIAVLPNGTNMLPYILLNVSIRVNNPVSSVFLRLECLEAPSLEDDYCHNHEEQFRRWGRMIWPCRFLTIYKPDLIRYPYFFNYHCFRLSSYSHYRLNVSCAPNLCRKSFIVTMPDETQVSPAINRFYEKDAATGDNYWSPLAFVDLTLPDRVVIRYERQPSLAASRISLAVFETIASTSTHLFTNTLDATAIEYEWRNVPAGNFTAYLYVNRLDCNLVCSNYTVVECILCPSTRIYFTVEEDKIWFATSAHGLSVGIYIIGIAVLCFAFATAFLVFFLATRHFHRVPLREVSLARRATVFIVYTDDSKPHSDCIAILAKVLQHDGNVDVFLDQFELNYSETLPLRWFINKFAAADHVVLIFSEGANAVLRGESLIQRQPFPEFFSVALNMLITEHSKDVIMQQPGKLLSETSLRFAFAYMSYSPSSVIPEELTSLPMSIFKLPDQVQNLILWLHNQPSDVCVDVYVDTSHLKSAVNEVMEYQRENPIWLTERLQVNRQKIEPLFALQNVPFQPSNSMLTPEEQVNIAETLNLEPPDLHNSMDEIFSKGAMFALIEPSNDSSFDSDDSKSEKIHLQQFLTAKQN